MPELEPPFRPREKLLEGQMYFQNVHKHTYLKGCYNAITSVRIPLALAASSLFLIHSFCSCNCVFETCSIFSALGRRAYHMSRGIEKKERRSS
ncbi:hypothetical protein BDA96_03G381900 [Sorghum bicolor]|uniref:Uncharacterized protein n=2 Tax=Sorghum bicolor TaxID=4558 RepID=A0A921RHX2_SORBI|nr:hypothetical protein BDA96_03G381900 [Sorghum bicolor]OQU87848.1 hypothetical protein SORBI_3003G354166 [Sorghum bicolor]